MMKVRYQFKDKKEFLEKYEKTAKDYDLERSRDFEGKQVDNLQINLIHSLLKKNKANKILEAGCGTGRILFPLAKKGYDCYGIDPSDNMLSVFKKKIDDFEKSGKELNIQLKKGDIENIPFKDNVFDAVYTVHVLMHMPDYKKAFKEMHRVAKKNGIIVCDFPNKDSLWTKLSILLDKKKKRTRLYSIKELKDFFKDYDYKMTGLFSYARTFYKIPVLRHVAVFLNKFLPLPLFARTQVFVVVKKK